MQKFVYEYATKVYFGEGAAKEHLAEAVSGYGENVMLAYGGGSVIDCCKIIAAQAKTDKDLWEMEMTDHQFPTDVIPMGAIVTASGTGAEMNGGAVITNEEKVIKAGMAAAVPRLIL